MTSRSVPEWIGKTPDTKIPDHVKLRIFDRENGRCYLSGRKIMPGDKYDFDHRIALVNWSGDGHGNRESNIFPALRDKHREKTRLDVAEKAKTYAVRSKHVLPSGPSKLKSRGFSKSAPQRRASGPVSQKFDGDIMGVRSDFGPSVFRPSQKQEG